MWDRLGVVPRRGQLGPGQGELCRELGFVPDFDGQAVGQLKFDDVTDMREMCKQLAKNSLAGGGISQHDIDQIGQNFVVTSRVFPWHIFPNSPHVDGLSFDATCAHDTLHLLVLMRSKLAPESEAEWRVSTNKNFSIAARCVCGILCGPSGPCL